MNKFNENRPQPPQWAQRLLALWGDPNTLEEVQGDLLEFYAQWTETLGERKARLRYSLTVLKLLRPFAKPQTPKEHPQPFIPPAMLHHYLTIAWRNLAKHQGYSALNIAGLTLGLATTLLILLWVKDEMRFDRFHDKYERIYNVKMHMAFSQGNVVTHAAMPQPLAAALKAEVPEMALAARTSWGGNLDPADVKLFSFEEKNLEEKGLYVDADFLKIFSFPFIQGDPKSALTEPNTLVLTQQLARKYFGNRQALGQVIRVNQETDYKVVGVVKDVPANSSLQFGYLMPMLDKYQQEGFWGNNNTPTYVLLQEGARVEQVDAKIKNFITRYLPEKTNETLFLHACRDWYLRSDFKNGAYTGGGRIGYVRLFGIVAGFVLLIACINFMNLSTARATGRAKEVGVRKAVGATKGWLVGQFLGESLLISGMSGLLALVIVGLVLPFFNRLLEKQIVLEVDNPEYLLGFLGMLLLTGFLAGIYPAFVLSGYKPEKALKGVREPLTGGAVWLRQSMVVLQFAASVLLIIGTIIVYRQINYIQHINLGYQKENLVWFDAKGLTSGNHAQYEQARAQLASVPGVLSVGVSNNKFQGPEYSHNNVVWPGKSADQEILFDVISSDYDLLPTLGMQLKEGRNFSRAFSTDTANVILNEEAVRQMGLEHPVGQPITVGEVKGTVVGVVNDFHLSSIHSPIRPAIMQCRPWRTWLFFARIEGRDVPGTINRLQTAYQKLLPGYPLNYHFVDQDYEKLYRSEMQIGELAKWFSVMAIFISCLGLFGLAAFTVERRTKEIGIRKVLGASLTGIFALVSKDFLKPVLIAIVIASPLAWYAMHQWLQNFAYKTSMEWWIFALAGVLATTIALLTVSLQTIKAALMNPVKSLRNE